MVWYNPFSWGKLVRCEYCETKVPKDKAFVSRGRRNLYFCSFDCTQFYTAFIGEMLFTDYPRSEK